MLAVVGATGYTGRLIVDELVRRGVTFVAVGRNPEKLEALRGDFERRVADASDTEAVGDAIDDCRAIVSCVGPFVDLGEPTLRAAVARGVHYIDTTGEQAFMRRVFEDYDAPARQAVVAVVPAIGFDYVPGDMAAALAGRALGRTPELVKVVYSVRKAKSSDGTKRTGMRVAEMPCLVRRGGRLVETSIGADEEDYPLPDGTTHVALWPGGEVLTVPRHTDAPDVAVYMRMPKVMAKMARGAKLAKPLIGAGQKALGDQTSGPSDTDRAKGRYTVVAEARAGADTTRCIVEGHDMYGMTAAAVAEALHRMTAGGFDRTGALAPAEAFAPDDFLTSLKAYLSWRVEA